MSYVIFKTDGAVLTTIADGTINTTSTPLGLPGRLYAGYGQVFDTNVVHLLENFANIAPPSNALAGQLWFNTTDSILYICPTDNETNPNNWIPIVSTIPGANTQLGNIDANNLNLTNTLTANLVDTDYLTVNIQANIANANVTGNANIANLRTANITTGASTTQGNLTGAFTVTGSATLDSKAGTAMWVTGGNLLASGVRTDNWYYANGVAVSFDGTYTNSNVTAFLPTYTGNVGLAGGAAAFNGNVLSTGSNTTDGTITGNWTLSAGSLINGLSGISGGNIVGQVGNALVASTVYTNAQPNITSVGTLSSLAVTGNANVGNIGAAAGVFTTVAGSLTTASQSNITSVGTLTSLGVNGTVTAVNITANTGVFTGNANGLNNIPGANVTGTVANAAFATSASSATTATSATSATTANTVSSSAQPAITSVGTLTGLNSSGIIIAPAFTANTGIFTGNGAGLTNLPGANVTGTVSTATTAGTVTTAVQPNITVVGTLTSLGVSGTITASNITANTGVFTGNGAGLTNIAGANVTGTVANATTATRAGTVTTAAQPNITSVGTITGLTSSGNITAPLFIGEVLGNIIPGNIVIPGGNTQVLFNTNGSIDANAKLTFSSPTGLLTVNGNVQATRFIGSGANLTSIPGANVTGTVPSATTAGSATTATSATTAGTVTTAAQPNITSVGTLSSLIVSSNLNAGNVIGTHFGSGAGLTNINGGNVSTVPTATFATTAGSVSSIPSGTRMLFAQSSAPTGWTKQTSNDNAALRVVSGAAGGGGSVDFTSAFTSSRTVSGTTADTALSEAQMPIHYHLGVTNTFVNSGSAAPIGPSTYLARETDIGGDTEYNLRATYSAADSMRTSSAGSGLGHNHAFSGSINLAVKYVDVIIAQKD